MKTKFLFALLFFAKNPLLAEVKKPEKLNKFTASLAVATTTAALILWVLTPKTRDKEIVSNLSISPSDLSLEKKEVANVLEIKKIEENIKPKIVVKIDPKQKKEKVKEKEPSILEPFMEPEIRIRFDGIIPNRVLDKMSPEEYSALVFSYYINCATYRVVESIFVKQNYSAEDQDKKFQFFLEIVKQQRNPIKRL